MKTIIRKATLRTLTMVAAGLVLALVGGTVHAQFNKPLVPPPPSVPKTPSGKKSPTPPPKNLPILAHLYVSATSAPAGTPVNVTVKLSKPAVWGGPAHLYSSDLKTVIVPKNVPLPVGKQQATVKISLRPVTKEKKVKIWATYGSKVQKVQWITVKPAPPMKVKSISPSKLAWGKTAKIWGTGLGPVIKVTFKNKVLPIITQNISKVEVRIPKGASGTAQLKLSSSPGFPMLVTSQKVTLGDCAPLNQKVAKGTKLTKPQYSFCKAACSSSATPPCETKQCAAAVKHVKTLLDATKEWSCNINKKLYTCALNRGIAQTCSVVEPNSKMKQELLDVYGAVGCLHAYKEYKADWKAVEDYRNNTIRKLCAGWH